jgi:hypothetical protein
VICHFTENKWKKKKKEISSFIRVAIKTEEPFIKKIENKKLKWREDCNNVVIFARMFFKGVDSY